MSDIHDEVLCADPSNFALAVNTKPFNTFYYKSPHLLEYILEPGYFNSVFECALRLHDRIEVVANSTGPAEHATLAVKKITNTSTVKHVEVLLLHDYRR
jgi:hypothetical protein